MQSVLYQLSDRFLIYIHAAIPSNEIQENKYG